MLNFNDVLIFKTKFNLETWKLTEPGNRTTKCQSFSYTRKEGRKSETIRKNAKRLKEGMVGETKKMVNRR